MFHCTVKRSLKWVRSFKLFQVEIFHWILYQLNLLPQPKENKTSYFYAHENRVVWTKMTFLSFIHTHWKTSRSSELNYVHTLWPRISHLGNTLSRNVFIYLSKEKRKNVHRSTVTPHSPHLENIQMPLSNRTNRRVVTQWKGPGMAMNPQLQQASTQGCPTNTTEWKWTNTRMQNVQSSLIANSKLGKTHLSGQKSREWLPSVRGRFEQCRAWGGFPDGTTFHCLIWGPVTRTLFTSTRIHQTPLCSFLCVCYTSLLNIHFRQSLKIHPGKMAPVFSKLFMGCLGGSAG